MDKEKGSEMEGEKLGKDEIETLMNRYKQRMDSQLKTSLEEEGEPEEVTSKEYEDFKKEYMPRHMTIYEKLCNISEKILKINPDKKKIPDYEEAIRICHLNVTPTGVMSFSILAPIILILVGGLGSFMLFQSMFFIIFFLGVGAAMLQPLATIPMFMANGWRMKSSNQMVICIFYIVTYMRHTSNIERAIEFASDHLSPPLSLDLKKVLWDVETEKYESIKESLDSYLLSWKKWNMEFVEAFHLVESSLYEPSEERRLALLDKSLSVILEETYEKMLHYAQNLKSPITMLSMLGIVLPILGLVILPLVVSFMCEAKWYHLAALYDVALPIGVYYLGKKILSTRPTGYGDTDESENPLLKKYKNIIFKFGDSEIKLNPMMIALIVGIVCLFIGISPLLMHIVQGPDYDIIWRNTAQNGQLIQTTYMMNDPDAKFSLLGYVESQGCPAGDPDAVGVGDIVGPFGLGASILGMFLIIGLGVGPGLYFKYRSANVIKIREESKKLEKEFAAALFQLGNRLGDGIPAEIAFSRVAEVMEESVSGQFFRVVSNNITRLGLSVEQAIFDPKIGALVYYPSSIIESSMKVLVESAKKGPKIAAQALISISTYIKEIHRVDERLKDLLAESISSMKSQIKFMTPAIAGIVIGITSMISGIIGKLGNNLRGVAGDEAGSLGPAGDMVNMFGEGVPTFYFQIIVGVYVVQIIYILTIIVNGIENGSDALNERYQLGVNLIKSTLTYILVALAITLIFNLISGTIMGSITP
jgi:hypothetical protein